MANAFKLVTDTGVGTSAATIHTGASSTETTIIGLTIANIVTSQIEVDVQIENNDGDNIYLIKAAPVPVGSSLVVVGGEQKVVLNASDVLKVTSNTASSADVALSIGDFVMAYIGAGVSRFTTADGLTVSGNATVSGTIDVDGRPLLMALQTLATFLQTAAQLS